MNNSNKSLNNSSSKIIIYSLSLLYFGLIFLIFYYFFGFEISFIITAVLGGFLYFKIRSNVDFHFYSKIISSQILNINKQNFQLNEFRTPSGKTKTKIYKWDDFSKTEFDSENQEIKLIAKNGKDLEINSKFSNWYFFIHNIPSRLRNNKIDHFNKNLFLDLSTCLVCGTIAFKNNKCMSCGSISYDEAKKDANYEEFKTELDYLKNEQLELFETLEEGEKVEFYLDEDPLFKLDKNWKPIVTEAEVIQFSKENMWD